MTMTTNLTKEDLLALLLDNLKLEVRQDTIVYDVDYGNYTSKEKFTVSLVFDDVTISEVTLG